MKKVRVSILGALCLTCALAGATLATNVASADMPANVSTFEIMEVASVRTGAPEGVRFLARIKTTEKNALENATFGAIVYPTEYITGEFTKDEATDVLDIVAEKWISESLYEEYGLDTEYSYFTAVVAGKEDTFPASFYQTSLTARGYVQIGENAPIYTESVVERSMAYVAGLALANGEADVNGVLSKVSTGVSVKVGAASYTLNKGETQKITFTYGGIELKQSDLVKIEYEVDNDDVVSVSADGTITALAGGTAGITATVTIGNVSTEFNLGARVLETINGAENLAQYKYFGYYSTNQTIVAFDNGAMNISTAGGAPTGSTTLCYVKLNAALLQEGIAQGYTSVQVKISAATAGMAVYNGGALAVYRGAINSETITFDLATYKDNGIMLDFFDSNGAPLAVTISGIYFVGNTNIDFTRNVVSVNTLGFLTYSGGLSGEYVENVTVNGATTKAIHVTSTGNAPADPGHRSHNVIIGGNLMTTALNAGYTKITVTVYTANGFDNYKANADGKHLGFKRNDGSTAAREVTVTYNLSDVTANGLYFCMGGNANGAIPVDMYITNIMFIGKPIDLSKNIVCADALTYVTGSLSSKYVDSVVVNGVTTNAIQVTSAGNMPANLADFSYTFGLNKDLIAAAIDAGYTKISVTIYTANSFDIYKKLDWGNGMSWQQNKAGQDAPREVVWTRNLSDLTANGVYFLPYGDTVNGYPVNMYVTNISFLAE